MSILTAHPIPGPVSEPIFRLSVAQYHAMIARGVLTDDDPVELVEGVLLFRMGKAPPHRIGLARVARALGALLPPQFSVQLQDPITLDDGEPEPDAAVIRGAAEDYPDRHPGPAEVLLVIEVADATLSRDRGIKLRSYARAGIVQYWIVNLEGRSVEVHREPEVVADEPQYRSRVVYAADGSIPLTLDGALVGNVPVAALLP